MKPITKTFEIKLPEDQDFRTIQAISVKTAVQQALIERGKLWGLYIMNRGFTKPREQDFKPGDPSQVLRAYFLKTTGFFVWVVVEVRRIS